MATVADLIKYMYPDIIEHNASYPDNQITYQDIAKFIILYGALQKSLKHMEIDNEKSI